MRIVDQRKSSESVRMIAKDIPNGTWFEDRSWAGEQLLFKTSSRIFRFHRDSGTELGNSAVSGTFHCYVPLDVELVIKGVLPDGG